MADRQLKIVVRTEIRKGFGDLTKQIQGLSKQLSQLSTLSTSINRLADAFDKVGTGANVARKATTSLTKETNNAIRIVNQYASAQDKATAKAVSLNAAVKKGSIDKSQALRAEIAILNEVIKKTGDLTMLESRRDSRGRFGYGGFSADAVKAIKATFAAEKNAVTEGGIRVVTEINNQNARIKAAMSSLTQAGTGNSRAKYNGIFSGVAVTGGGAQYGPQLGGRYAPRYVPGAQLKNFGSGGRGGSGGGGGSSRPNLGPSSGSVSAVQTLIQSYNKLGHVIFQLQMATYTLFGLSGIGMILKQSDAYTELRNEVARTSDSTKDLGKNMKDVFDIAKDTYSDAGAVGKLFAKVNKYSTDLGLSREQVSNVTRGISGAFAASSGTADAKSAAQYQFLQAFQSGRLGGDELRSILEQADFVGDILSKGVGKVRGTGPINLRDSENPVTPQEIVKVFDDPAIREEINRVLADRARTFGDVLQLAKTRMMEYTGRVQEATGSFGGLANTLARFIRSDKFDKFTSALEDATVAAVTFALVAGGRAGAGMLVKGGKSVLAAGGTALAGARNTVGSARMLSAANGGGMSGAAAVGGQIVADLIPNILKFGKALWSIKGLFAIGAAAIALLVGRFNSLLKASGSAINMFDILVYAFRKIVSVGKAVTSVLGNIFSPILNFVDKFLLSPLVRAVIGNKEIQGIANARIAANKAAEDGLPTNQKGKIPGLAPDKDGNGKKRDPWKEFITDTSQSMEKAKNMLAIPSQYRDIEEGVQDIQKRAADALDLLNFEELQKKFPKKAAEVEQLTERFRELKLSEKINAFYDSIVDDLYKLRLDIPIPGMTAKDRGRRDNRITAINKFMENPNINMDKYREVYGNVKDDEVMPALNNRIKQLTEDGNFSGARDLIAAYSADGGYDFDKMVKDLDAIQDRSDAIKGSWQNGIRDGIAQARDSFTDLAGEVSGVVTNAFRSLEDSLVNWIQTGKFEWKDFVSSILADLITLFVRQRLLKPLFDFVGGTSSDTNANSPVNASISFMEKMWGGLNGKSNLTGADGRGNPGEMGGVINGTPGSISMPQNLFANIGSMFTKFFSGLTNILGSILGGIGKTGGGLISTAANVIASLFHSGGLVGTGGGSRNIAASAFANATRYHTGGIAGLAPNEVPAVLQRGERVLSLSETRAYGRGGGGTFAPQISIKYTAAPSGQQSQMSQEEHAAMLSKMVQSVIQQEIVNYDIKSRKPGSANYVATKFN